MAGGSVRYDPKIAQQMSLTLYRQAGSLNADKNLTVANNAEIGIIIGRWRLNVRDWLRLFSPLGEGNVRKC